MARSLRLLVLGLLGTLVADAAIAGCDCPAGFELRALGATTMQIAVAWDAVPNATGYVVERSTSCDFAGAVRYELGPATRAYGDTGRAPSDRLRFHAPPALSAGIAYNYRVRAPRTAGGELLSSCVTATLATGPVRGVAGDLWADLVLGQPDFAQNDFRATTADRLQAPGGMVIDRSTAPNRLWIADTNHNRLLGYDHIGACGGFGAGLAVGRPYVKSLEPASQYPDDGGEFTDGADAGPWDLGTDSFGYAHPLEVPLTVDVDVDLGAPVTFDSARLDSGARTDRYTAVRLVLFASDDAQDWAEIASADNPERAFGLELTFPPTTARWVRFRATSQSGCVDCDWLFLGEGRVGLATASGGPCDGDADCDGGTCSPDPALVPQVVLGQPAAADHGACNGDGTAQAHPGRAPASETGLCLIHPLQISIGETITGANPAVDAEGALWVPDLHNHRVLRFDDPFATDAIADAVLGQAGFAGNACNRGGAPAADTLCLAEIAAPSAGLAIDLDGSVWVADAANARVLRFPRLGGAVAASADVVLGQPSFASDAIGDVGRGLGEMAYPLDVAVDPATGRLYVADAGHTAADGRVLEFAPPFVPTGQAALRALPVSLHCDFAYPGQRPIGVTLDSRIHGLWVENNCFYAELFDLADPGLAVRARVRVVDIQGADVDANGDLAAVGKFDGAVAFARDRLGLDDVANDTHRRTVVQAGLAPPTAADLWSPAGVTTFGDQLVVADAHRLLTWSDWDATAAANGAPADDLWGEASFESATFQQYVSYPQEHGGRLWVQRRRGGELDLLAFDPPLANASVPVEIVPLTATPEFDGYPVLGCPEAAFCDCTGTGCRGEAIAAHPADALDFTFAAGGDELWIADRWGSRVFRIANRLGARDPLGGPFVDVVLGQATLAETGCNRGLGPPTPTAGGLCYPYDLALDPSGNLYVADNGGETGSNHRLLEFDLAALPPVGAAVAAFGVPATRVFGTGGLFDVRGELAPSDPFLSPFKPAFDAAGTMVVGNNPYATQRLPLVWTAPLAERLPQLTLGDMTSYPWGSAFFDARGDLYLTDSNWSRVLVYREPFAHLAPRGAIDEARLTIRRNLDPAGDERFRLAGQRRFTLPAPDPIADGFTLTIRDADGAPVLARTVAGGLAPTPDAPGWSMNGRRDRWTFRDDIGALAGGVTKLVVRDRSRRVPGLVTFKVQGRGDFQIGASAVPVAVEVGLGPEPGQRARAAFGPADGPRPRCTSSRNGATLTCR